MAGSDAPVSILIGNRGSYIFSTGSFKHSSLSPWNAFSWFGPHNHGVFFFVRLVSGIAVAEKSLISKLLVVVDETHKGLYLFDIDRWFPFLDSSQFFRVHSNSMSSKDKA